MLKISKKCQESIFSYIRERKTLHSSPEYCFKISLKCITKRIATSQMQPPKSFDEAPLCVETFSSASHAKIASIYALRIEAAPTTKIFSPSLLLENDEISRDGVEHRVSLISRKFFDYPYVFADFNAEDHLRFHPNN